MTPLAITARLGGPASLSNGPPAIDAILMAAVAMRDNLPPLSVVGAANATQLDIPIARSACGRVWLASFANYAVEESEGRWVNRKFPIAEAQLLGEPKLRRINISAGAQKSYRLPLETVHLVDDTMRWWCLGDDAAIRELLALVSYVGKKRSTGLGKVREWTVEPCEPWPGFPVLRDGVPMRTLPRDWEGLAEYDLAFRVLDPPYWDHAREEECAVPL